MPAMIAVVPIENEVRPCVIYWTGRVRLSVKVRTWCGREADASDGVIQVPATAHVCTKCEEFIETGKPNV